MYVRMYVCMYVRMYVRMYVCMYFSFPRVAGSLPLWLYVLLACRHPQKKSTLMKFSSLSGVSVITICRWLVISDLAGVHGQRC